MCFLVLFVKCFVILLHILLHPSVGQTQAPGSLLHLFFVMIGSGVVSIFIDSDFAYGSIFLLFSKRFSY